MPACPYCSFKSDIQGSYPLIVRFGHFYRRSDSRKIQRFRCLGCKKSFSNATHHSCFRQKKRHKNEPLRRLLSSGISQRRAARILHLTRRTIVRKLIFLAHQARFDLERFNLERPRAEIIEFDDLETFEHTKCKPLSVTLAVESKTRRILGFEVSQMPAKGLLAKIAVKRYGRRPDFRSQGRSHLFERIGVHVADQALIKSDSNPHYISDVERFFPSSEHERHPGQRGSITGQGELKKIRFDPLFSLNHTCAKLRADVNRLFRKTWCTTKDPKRLADHLAIYALYHNQHLKSC